MHELFNTTILPILIGVISSFIASIVFLLALSRFRPSINISPQIAKFVSKRESNNFGYSIKVINNSRRPVVDIQVRFAIVTKKNVPSGSIMQTKDLQLERSKLFEIPGKNRNNPSSAAFRFVTYEDLNELWKDDNADLMFVLFTKDSLTGFGKVFTQEYYLKRMSLIEGNFHPGNTFNIS